MTTYTEDLARLRELLPKVTPGPLKAVKNPMYRGDHKTLIELPHRSGLRGTWVASTEHNWDEAVAGERRISWAEAEANAEATALLLTHAEALLDERDRLREALKPFVDSASHTEVFLRTKEKMHRDGRALYASDVERARTALGGKINDNSV